MLLRTPKFLKNKWSPNPYYFLKQSLKKNFNSEPFMDRSSRELPRGFPEKSSNSCCHQFFLDYFSCLGKKPLAKVSFWQYEEKEI